ncbi:DNA mismatch repair protein [Aneurinibacillus sp. BA2021]|nr:DNA mismatch repair protein [Aneurinibacillus sp. BA2021]
MKKEKKEIQLTREEIIQHGLHVFQSVGAHHVCSVCIRSGHSCCYVCVHMEDGIGCQKRNIACTAWLCGLQKLLFHSIGLIDPWQSFWEQVPGQDFRRDDTPPLVHLTFCMPVESLDQQAGERLAEWLAQYAEKGGDIGKLEGYLATRYKYNRLEDVSMEKIGVGVSK